MDARENEYLEKIDFLGLSIGALDKAEIVNKILEFALTGKGKFITYLNAHCLNIYFSDAAYKEILDKADLVYAGGQGVVWASRFLGKPLPERVNILDFFDRLVKKLREKNISIYLLGGTSNTIEKLKQALRKEGLNIVGYRDGFFDNREENEVIEEINALQPNILMVGMGVPKQEKWIFRHLEKLDVNLCWAVGGLFRVISGELKKPPQRISDYGLEWLFLGLQDPIRLLKRYLIGNIIFLYRILHWRIKHGSYG